MTNETMWDRVKRLLKENKYTQNAAAEVCCVKLSTFQSWIRKDYYPTILGGYALARFLGVTVEYLVTGKEREAKKQIETVRSVLKEADEKLKKISV